MVKVNLINVETLALGIAKKGMNRKDFAEKVEISETYLALILQERKNPSPKLAYKIATVLDLKVDDLFEYKYLEETIQ